MGSDVFKRKLVGLVTFVTNFVPLLKGSCIIVNALKHEVCLHLKFKGACIIMYFLMNFFSRDFLKIHYILSLICTCIIIETT